MPEATRKTGIEDLIAEMEETTDDISDVRVYDVDDKTSRLFIFPTEYVSEAAGVPFWLCGDALHRWVVDEAHVVGPVERDLEAWCGGVCEEGGVVVGGRCACLPPKPALARSQWAFAPKMLNWVLRAPSHSMSTCWKSSEPTACCTAHSQISPLR